MVWSKNLIRDYVLVIFFRDLWCNLYKDCPSFYKYTNLFSGIFELHLAQKKDWSSGKKAEALGFWQAKQETNAGS